MNGIVYFKTNSPYTDISDDFTKNCSLAGIEIDNNFMTLEGRDVISIQTNGNEIIITLYNGNQLKCNISGLSFDVSPGSGIDVEAFNNGILRTDASLIGITSEITFTGEPIGSYQSGDVIFEGTSIESILKKLLTKVYDVVPILPASSICPVFSEDYDFILNDECGFEVGREITCTLNTSYYDGAFIRDDDALYNVPSQCNALNTNYFLNGNSIGTTVGSQAMVYSFNNTDNPLLEGIHTFECDVDYNNSLTVGRKSDGTPSEVIIPAGTTEITYSEFCGRYAFYYGFIPPNPNAYYADIVTSAEQLYNPSASGYLNLNFGFCEIDKNTEIKTITSTAENSSFILILPDKYKWILSTKNSMGYSLDPHEKWKEQVHIQNGAEVPLLITDYWNGTVYHAYILHSYCSITYNDIMFGME